MSKFDDEIFKVKVMGELKGQGHIIERESNQGTSLLFHLNPTNHSWDMSNSPIVFDLKKKKIPEILKKRITNNRFQQNYFKNLFR